MYSFRVNGREVQTEEDKTLLRYLRDDLQLHSVKDGCSQGACGACMILVDGKATRACVIRTSRAAGKSILTVEGLPDFEKEAFVYAFGVCGAVQCGFCTPGMVMSAKALLDGNPDPDETQIRAAIRGNICRCTGYEKIVEAIRMTASILRGETKIEESREKGVGAHVGSPLFRKDVREKVLGYGKYPDDIEIEDVRADLGMPADASSEGHAAGQPFDAAMVHASGNPGSQAGDVSSMVHASGNPGDQAGDVSSMVHASGSPGDQAGDVSSMVHASGSPGGQTGQPFDMSSMVHASCVRSRYPRARILRIDSSKAQALPGVLGVLTAEDVPHNKVGHLQQDWDVMIPVGGITRMVGDAVCIVTATSREILEQAKKLVEVEYEVLEPIRSVDEARAPGAPLVHYEKPDSGNLCQSRHVMRGDAKRALEHSKYKVTETFETPFTEHAFLEPECAVAYPYKDGVKILSSDQGVYDTRHEVSIMFDWDPSRVVVENALVGGGFGGKEDVSAQHIAALCAWKYKRAVKVHFSRQESINFHPKRHAMKGTFTLGCDEHGMLTALDCDIFFDTGAYASLCGPVLERACTHAVGPYTYQNYDIRGYGYYTNNPPAGAFRGFGVCQTQFALELLIDRLAKMAGISPWEMRYRNAIEPGRVLPNGQIADRSTAYKETLLAVRDIYEKNAGHAGLAGAMKNSGVGVGLPDKGRAKIRIEHGEAVIYSAASDIGQGSRTVLCQDAAEATGIPVSRIRMAPVSTETSPDSGTTSGSRQTLITGEAVRGAAVQLREAMEEIFAAEAGKAAEEPGRAAEEPGRPAEEAGRAAEEAGRAAEEPGRAGRAMARVAAGAGDEDLDRALAALEGREFSYTYFEPTDKLGAKKPNPKSHVAYSFAANVAVLDEGGRITDIYAAYDVGQVVNPTSAQGQIEGGALMSMGYAVSEDFPLKDCVPTAKYGTLGLLRADQAPRIHAILVKKSPDGIPEHYGIYGTGLESDNGPAAAPDERAMKPNEAFEESCGGPEKRGRLEGDCGGTRKHHGALEFPDTAYGAKGIGEVTSIPAAPAIAAAYYEMTGEFQTKLPLHGTPYRRK